MKSFSILIYICFSFILIACDNKNIQVHTLTGNAQGTTFNIKYYGDQLENDKDSVTQVFQEMDRCFSLWVENSELNKMNECPTDTCVILDTKGHIRSLFNISQSVYNETRGDFNPALHPLINAWGFGSKEQEIPDTSQVDSLLVKTHFSKWGVVSPTQIIKESGGSLDFNAIAQGYSIDVLADYFERNGIENYFIELGGEVRVSGIKPGMKKWSIGLEKPSFDGSRQNIDTLYLSTASIATSGSYRKFRELNGKKYSHTIDPNSGFPVSHQLLSATVIAPDCATADAYATAFMVKGKEESIEFLNNNRKLELKMFLIYEEEDKLKTYYSSGFEKYLAE